MTIPVSSSTSYFHRLPLELKENIFNLLPDETRMSSLKKLRQVDKKLAQETAQYISRIALINIDPQDLHSAAQVFPQFRHLKMTKTFNPTDISLQEISPKVFRNLKSFEVSTRGLQLRATFSPENLITQPISIMTLLRYAVSLTILQGDLQCFDKMPEDQKKVHADFPHLKFLSFSGCSEVVNVNLLLGQIKSLNELCLGGDASFGADCAQNRNTEKNKFFDYPCVEDLQALNTDGLETPLDLDKLMKLDLKFLDLSCSRMQDNDWTQLLSQLYRFKNLEYLSLENSKLQGNHIMQLNIPNTLKILDLSHNDFQKDAFNHFLTAHIDKLQNLEAIFIDTRDMQPDIESLEAVAKLKNCKIIRLTQDSDETSQQFTLFSDFRDRIRKSKPDIQIATQDDYNDFTHLSHRAQELMSLSKQFIIS